MENLKFKIKSQRLFVFLMIFILLTTYYFLFSDFAYGYPIENFSGVGLDEANTLSQSINRVIRSLIQTDLFRAFARNGTNSIIPASGGGQIQWINLKNFSQSDLSGAIKAVAILFLQIIITILGVTIGILKVILELITSRF